MPSVCLIGVLLLSSGRLAPLGFFFGGVLCRVAVLDKVTDFLLFLGKLLISGSVGECFFLLLVSDLKGRGCVDENFYIRLNMFPFP